MWTLSILPIDLSLNVARANGWGSHKPQMSTLFSPATLLRSPSQYEFSLSKAVTPYLSSLPRSALCSAQLWSHTLLGMWTHLTSSRHQVYKPTGSWTHIFCFLSSYNAALISILNLSAPIKGQVLHLCSGPISAGHLKDYMPAFINLPSLLIITFPSSIGSLPSAHNCVLIPPIF